MKRTCALLFFFITISLTAQNWCPPGAVWTYSLYGDIAGVGGSCEFNYQSDTIIDGQVLKKITGLFKGYDNNRFRNLGYNTYTVVPDYSVYYMKETDGVVFVLNSQNELDTVVNYAAKIGDMWRVPLGCHTYTVSDTSSIVVNSIRLRVIEAQFLAPFVATGDTVLMSNTFTERIAHFMVAGSGFDFIPSYCIMSDVYAEFPAVWFLCYKDDQLGAYSPGGYKCQTTLALDQERGGDVNVLVLPVKGELRVTCYGTYAARLTVADAMGRIVKVRAVNPGYNIVDLEQPGIYFVQLRDNNDRVFNYKFVFEN